MKLKRIAATFAPLNYRRVETGLLEIKIKRKKPDCFSKPRPRLRPEFLKIVSPYRYLDIARPRSIKFSQYIKGTDIQKYLNFIPQISQKELARLILLLHACTAF